MWAPTITNAFFNDDSSNAGLTFCQVASTAVSSSNSVSIAPTVDFTYPSRIVDAYLLSAFQNLEFVVDKL